MGDTRLVTLFGKCNLSTGSYYLLWVLGLRRMLCFFLMGREEGCSSLKPTEGESYQIIIYNDWVCFLILQLEVCLDSTF